MVTLDESIIARLKTHGKTFEVFVEPEGALAYKKGDPVKIENILAVEEVFEDARMVTDQMNRMLLMLSGRPMR